MNKIINCKKCKLHLNQKPLLEIEIKDTDIMFLGVSAVKIKHNKINEPLAKDTRTGKVIEEIETISKKKISRSNLVKCLPIDKNNKIRYPKKNEMELCFENFIYEIKEKKPKKIILLGKDISEFILKEKINFPIIDENLSYSFIEKEGIKYLAIHHPSYILRKSKDTRERYKNVIANLIK